MSLFAAGPTSVDIIFRTFAIFPIDLSFIFRFHVRDRAQDVPEVQSSREVRSYAWK